MIAHELTEEELVRNLPMVAEWEPELRARFVAGMKDLVSRPIRSPDIRSMAGVVTLYSGVPPRAGILTKADCAAKARSLGIDQELIDAMLTDSGPGMLDVLVLADTYQLVFAVPMMLIPVGDN